MKIGLVDRLVRGLKYTELYVDKLRYYVYDVIMFGCLICNGFVGTHPLHRV